MRGKFGASTKVIVGLAIVTIITLLALGPQSFRSIEDGPPITQQHQDGSVETTPIVVPPPVLPVEQHRVEPLKPAPAQDVPAAPPETQDDVQQQVDEPVVHHFQHIIYMCGASHRMTCEKDIQLD